VVHAAWVAPVVVAASAAPAYAMAASSNHGLAVNITSASSSAVTGLAILAQSTITNLGSVATTNLYVIMRFELDDTDMWGSTPIATAPGWQIGSASGNSGSRIRTFSAQAQVELGPAGSPNDNQPFNPTITTNALTPPTGTIQMTAYPFIGGPPAVDEEPIVNR
jgi:hypothetical protein